MSSNSIMVNSNRANTPTATATASGVASTNTSKPSSGTNSARPRPITTPKGINNNENNNTSGLNNITIPNSKTQQINSIDNNTLLAAAAAIEQSDAANSADLLAAQATAALNEARAAENASNSASTASNAVPVVLKTKIPRLDDLIIKHIADNYATFPCLDLIPKEYLPNVIELIDVHAIPFINACIYIDSELFWKKLTAEYYSKRIAIHSSELFQQKFANVALHGNSYKRLFIEQYVEKALESYISSPEAEEKLLQEISAANSYIYKLNLTSFASHADLSLFLAPLNHLSALEIHYGARQLGMDYDKSLFGIKENDCTALNTLLLAQNSLISLNLSENLIGNHHFHVLLKGFTGNNSITELNLSGNNLGDAAAAELGELLAEKHSILTKLNLNNNNISAAGAKSLASALKINSTLQDFNLSLNCVENSGLEALISALIGNKNNNLQYLDLNSCSININNSAAGLDLLEILSKLWNSPNNKVISLNLACNNLFGLEPHNTNNLINQQNKARSAQLSHKFWETFSAALEGNSSNETLVELELRLTGLSDEIAAELKGWSLKRQAKVNRVQRLAFQQKGYDEVEQ
jgi:hypothetical protein